MHWTNEMNRRSSGIPGDSKWSSRWSTQGMLHGRRGTQVHPQRTQNLNRLIVVVIMALIIIMSIFWVKRTLLHRLVHSILTMILLLSPFSKWGNWGSETFPRMCSVMLTNTGTNFRESFSTLGPCTWDFSIYRKRSVLGNLQILGCRGWWFHS